MAQAGKGLAKKMAVSPELQAVIKVKTASRAEVTKKIWEYIKKNDLQDPNDKRTILADAKLAPIIGKKINMLKLAGAITPHLDDL